MISLVDLRCRRISQLVEAHWPGCTAEIFSSTEDRITFRIRSKGGRFRTGKITLPGDAALDRDWLSAAIEKSLFGATAA
jgi:hypothetical protein